MRSSAKSTGSGNRRPPLALNILLLLVIAAALAGCARPPWGELVAKDRHRAVEHAYGQVLDAVRSCGSGLDGEVVVNWHDALDTFSFSGFVRLSTPASLKLTALNPLGQPLFAVASDGANFQSVNTTSKTFYSGSLRSYGIRNDIPPAFFTGHVATWITGRPDHLFPHILEIREDARGRGVWLAVSADAEGAQPVERVLLDVGAQRLVERQVIDAADGAPLATIVYAQWQEVDGCSQPLDITVTGLSFGAGAHLQLSDVRQARLEPEQFSLPIPPAYNRQFLP